ncbi:jg12399 [Pararge aegeria aegeria]|uniref:Jg12399 protein n=1 Tax=Pararge aegeria aegeria TaxID=348720 RepID=A0A8S4S6Z7_9NEOP|nr:jg12399 [Pararge aegeria aegeria]
MLGVSTKALLSDQIRNEEVLIRPTNQSSLHSSTSREAEVAMGGPHSSEKGCKFGSKLLEWCPRTGKSSVGSASKKWTNDIKRVAGPVSWILELPTKYLSHGTGLLPQ